MFLLPSFLPLFFLVYLIFNFPAEDLLYLYIILQFHINLQAFFHSHFLFFTCEKSQKFNFYRIFLPIQIFKKNLFFSTFLLKIHPLKHIFKYLKTNKFLNSLIIKQIIYYHILLDFFDKLIFNFQFSLSL